ncbi:MAG: response regulator [Bdellovibrionales bacterium]|nr:response regulator [Bdellovibrionales bacterium]
MSYFVLIIDDDSSFRRLVSLRLKSFMQDLTIVEHPNLNSAREYFKSNEPQFDLVVLDQHLPDGRGLELLNEGYFSNFAVLAVSSDDAPEIPGATLQAGATYFLNKVQISEPLFKPLVLGLIDRNRLQRELESIKENSIRTDTIRTLVGTLRHEINNPLGAVLGAAYLMRTQDDTTSEQKQAAEVVESSGKRIKHVLDELCKAISIDEVTKAQEKVFHIPGDEPWEQ